MPNLFFELSIILAIAAVIGGAGILLRQPLIVSFIAVGILVGPAALDLVTMEHEMKLLAEIGIAVLLFVVGLRLDLTIIRTMGPVALATGLGQVLFTSVFGFLLCLAMGLPAVHSLYIAVALTFSSTIIIVKLLSDKREIDALHGRIAVGFLIVQDIVVVLVMIGLSTFAGAGSINESTSPVVQGLVVLGKGAAMLASIGLLMRYVIPRMVHVFARSQELLILFAIAWAVGLGAIGEWLGFSKEVGAFLAGISLASTPFRESIGGRLVSIRDFLLIFFFVELGATLDLHLLGAQIGPATVLSLFVLVGNPIIVMVIMGAMGYRKRTGFLAGLTVAQISEFSLILAALGLTVGHINNETLGLITLVGLITIGLSTYLIIYSHQIYDVIGGLLGVFERRIPFREVSDDESRAVGIDVIIFGLGRYGSNIARGLRREGLSVLGIDFDPQVVNEWNRQGYSAQYGDASDPEFANALPLDNISVVICAAPEINTNLTLLNALRGRGYACPVALTAHTSHEANRLQEAGADMVLMPFVDAADRAAAAVVEEFRKPADNERSAATPDAAPST